MCNRCAGTTAGLSRRTLILGLAASGALCCAPLPAEADATVIELPAPKPDDVCPVCGMFVEPYPLWVATIVFKDGRAVHFDGAKDFHKYLLDMGKYAPGRSRADIGAMGVTGYYATDRLDAGEALYVVGSDVLGPMGHELVPHASEADAREFLADHKGKRIVRAGDITMALLEGLDAGRFE